MTRIIALLAASLATLLAGCSLGSGKETLSGLTRIEGRWLTDDHRNMEQWTADSDTHMTGKGFTRSTDFHEDLAITIDGNGRTVYLASPMGRQPPTPFHLISRTVTVTRGHRTDEWTFENPGHDFPQRIVYHLDGDTFTATISSMDAGDDRTSTCTFRRIR